jgi:Protein of unknown function (DUF2846)
MTRLHIFVTALCVLILSGCATGGATFSDMSGGMPAPAPGMGRIIFYRTTVFGAAVQPDVKLNGEVVGTAKPRGFFYADRPAGDYEVSTATETEKKLTFTLAENETRYVRLEIGFGILVGRVYGVLVEQDEAEKDLSSMHYTGVETN